MVYFGRFLEKIPRDRARLTLEQAGVARVTEGKAPVGPEDVAVPCAAQPDVWGTPAIAGGM